MALVLNGSANTISGLAVGGISSTKAIAAAAMPSESIIQVKSFTKTDSFTTTSTSLVDVTDLTISLTMTVATNKVLVTVSLGMMGMVTAGQGCEVALVRGSTLLALGDAAGNRTRVTAALCGDVNHETSPGIITYLDTPGTGTHAYKIQMATQDSGTATINQRGDDADGASYQRASSTITVMEVVA